MDKNKLNDILDRHSKWLRGCDDGKCAGLSYADLHRADLRFANLRGADLCFANLCFANLSYADLRFANLRGADLRDADLSDAVLRGADLTDANLSGANLSGVNLYGTDLQANITIEIANKYFPLCCPEVGEFIGWKKCGDYIIKLKITDAAKRSSAFGRKCRCSEAIVLSIEQVDGSEADVISVRSDFDNKFVYRVGDTVRVDAFDEDRTHECAQGIHFFITRQEAVEY